MASIHSPQNTILSQSPSKAEKELSDAIEDQNWDAVIKLHKENQEAFQAKVTTGGDTALIHLISEGTEKEVETLVGILKGYGEAKSLRILQITDDKLRTPLHEAAVRNRHLCEIIIGRTEKEKFNKLLHKRDCFGQTPIFQAVRYDQMEAFLYLHDLVFDHDEDVREYCWDDDGQTILHIAITREYFDLAYQIIELYPKLVNRVDKKGMSPLHALARKPAAFKSNSTFRGRSKIIYNFLSVEELKVVKSKTDSDKEQSVEEHSKNESNEVEIEINVENTPTISKAHKSSPTNNVNTMTFSELACSRIIPFFLGYGQSSVRKIKAMKMTHVQSVQVLDALLKYADKESLRASDLQTKRSVEHNDLDTTTKESQVIHTTPLLLAAKYGIMEIIEKIINGRFPMAIKDRGMDNKNIVLLALQNRHVYKFLLNKYKRDHIMFQNVDKKENTVLHYAAMYGSDCAKQWPVPGAALQMQWEIKFYEYIGDTMPARMCSKANSEGKIPKELFSETHKDLVRSGGQWLTSTATSCSVVAALIATVAFASIANVPGGSDNERSSRAPQGALIKYKNPSFELIAVLSLIALCFSVTSLLMFLAILTSRHQEMDFGISLPRKILFGLSSLFIAIASMLVTFCTGHFLVFEDRLNKYAVLPVYAVTLLPLCFFATAQFPLYFDLLLATFSNPFRGKFRMP